jgi:hypothetical protein
MAERHANICDLINLFKQEGSRLARPIQMEGLPPMTFSCTLSAEGVDPNEFGSIPHDCPADLREFWSIVRTAKLFEDVEYGQWGLEILSPEQSIKATMLYRSYRGKDFFVGDLVIGKFLGDSELLIIRCDRSKDDFGNVLISTPLDSRAEWDRPAESLATFLETYAKTGGEKYWDRQ